MIDTRYRRLLFYNNIYLQMKPNIRTHILLQTNNQKQGNRLVQLQKQYFNCTLLQRDSLII